MINPETPNTEDNKKLPSQLDAAERRANELEEVTIETEIPNPVDNKKLPSQLDAAERRANELEEVIIETEDQIAEIETTDTEKAEERNSELDEIEQKMNKFEQELGGQLHEQLKQERIVSSRKRVIEKYQKETQFDRKIKRHIEKVLDQETEQIHFKIAEQWFNDNSDKIREAGSNPDNKGRGHIIRVVNEMGGFEELEGNEDKEYQDKVKEINHYEILKQELNRSNMSIDSQYLMLNLLNKRTERIKGEEDQAVGKKEKKAQQEELKKLLETRKKISEKISNEDLEDQIEGEYGKKPHGERMYNWFASQKRQSEIEKITEEKIDEIGGSLDRAKGGIKGMYQRVQDRIAVECIEKKLKTAGSSQEQLKEINKEFNKRGINPTQIITDAFKYKDAIDDPKQFEALLGNYGIQAGSEDIENIIGKIGKKEKEMDFLTQFLFVIFSLIEKQK